MLQSTKKLVCRKQLAIHALALMFHWFCRIIDKDGVQFDPRLPVAFGILIYLSQLWNYLNT